MTPARDARSLEVRVRAAAARAGARREQAAALAAQGRQEVRRAHAARQHGNLLLDTAASIVADVMARRGLAVAQPVTADFRTDACGSTGIVLTVRLEDSRDIPEATAAIDEYFGLDADGVDVVCVS